MIALDLLTTTPPITTANSPGDKDADWQTHVGRRSQEQEAAAAGTKVGAEEGKGEGLGGDAAAAAVANGGSGVAAPALLQAASSIWAVSAASLVALFGGKGCVAVD